jgi:transcriptional regulator with XRE-family HTH domain
MDDRRVGMVLRALRRRKAWRQRDVADKAHVSQQFIAELESGQIEHMDLARSRRVAAVLGASLEIMPRWRGPELDRLLDADHAALVDSVASALMAAHWEVITEWTFSHFGERGSIDLVGWHASTSALAIVEVKSRVVDIQALLSSVDRKARLASSLLAVERGWRSTSVGRLLVLPDGSTSRDVLARHAASLGTAFPDRGVALRRWLQTPSGPMAGVWFVRNTAKGGAPGKPRPHPGTRVRPPRSDAAKDPARSSDLPPGAVFGTRHTRTTIQGGNPDN